LNKKQRKRKAKKAKAQATYHPDPSLGQVPETPQTHGCAEAQPRNNDSKDGEDTMKKEPVSNWFLVIFTAALVLTGFLQWDAIKGQLKAMIDADRPWVGAILFSADPIEARKDGTAKISVVNSGRGPARILSFKASLHVFDKFPAEPAYDDAPSWMDLSRTIVLPGMPATNEFPFKGFNPIQFQMVLDGNTRLYLYGVVEYEDLRVKNSHHTTKMCAYWTAKKLTTPFVNCPEYNEAD
jgi:hypothetical protein